MQDKQRKLRQLDAAVRLRGLQREKAELRHGGARRALEEATRLLNREQAHYAAIMAKAQQQMHSGVQLDPCLHEQRLLTQLAAHARIETQAKNVSTASADHQQAIGLLLKCKLDEEVASKAHHRVAEELSRYAHGQEVIDISDAQQAQGVAHGF